MEPDALIARIRAELPDARVELQGQDCSFMIHVVSARFEGMRPLARQQAILRLFAQELAEGNLHALSVGTKTPAEAQASLVSLSLE